MGAGKSRDKLLEMGRLLSDTVIRLTLRKGSGSLGSIYWDYAIVQVRIGKISGGRN